MYDIIVVGAGPAGLTAALYALRASKSVLVIEQSTFGGQVTFSPKIENYPGIPEMSGNEFAEKLISGGETVLVLKEIKKEGTDTDEKFIFRPFASLFKKGDKN